MKRVTIQTLGCKLNQFESDSLATKFRQAGYRLVDPGGGADAHIINTCTVTGKADRKSRNLIYQAQRYAREYERRLGTGALVVVTGCFAEGNADEIAALENVYVVGNGRKSAIFEIVDAHLRGEIADGTEALTSQQTPQQQPLSPGETAETQEAASENLFRYVTPERLFHTRGMLKIQDGCDNYCTFCIIPYVRGKAASRPVAGVLADMRRMVDMGYREIVLTGVNMSRYRDGECNFSTLLEQLLECEGDFRLRISSLEPDQLDERFFALLQHPKMAAHLHLCLQSGSERVLLQMRRQYTAAQYRTMADRIRKVNPLFNITTDIIVGFPDESSQDFDASCDFVRDYTMGHVHVFPYAVRRGTRAARMSGAVSASVLKERAGALRTLAAECTKQYRAQLCGQTLQVLIEESSKSNAHVSRGYCEYYVPVEIPRPGLTVNNFYSVATDTQLANRGGGRSSDGPVLVGNLLPNGVLDAAPV